MLLPSSLQLVTQSWLKARVEVLFQAGVFVEFLAMYLEDVVENTECSLSPSPRDLSFEQWQLILLEASTKSILKQLSLKCECSLFLQKLMCHFPFSLTWSDSSGVRLYREKKKKKKAGRLSNNS